MDMMISRSFSWLVFLFLYTNDGFLCIIAWKVNIDLLSCVVCIMYVIHDDGWTFYLPNFSSDKTFVAEGSLYVLEVNDPPCLFNPSLTSPSIK